MSNLLSSIRNLTGQGRACDPCSASPTHEAMLLEHEKRKGKQFRSHLEHEARFLRYR